MSVGCGIGGNGIRFGVTFTYPPRHPAPVGDIVRQVDSRGRILIPASWRKKHAIDGKVLLTEKGDVVEILPLDQTDLTVHFDAVEVDVEADLADWHRVRRQLPKG